MFVFKVDFDVVSEENDFQFIYWKYGNIMDVFKIVKKENIIFLGYFFYNLIWYVEWEYVKNERVLNIDLKNFKFWIFVNNNKFNYWGVSRGYCLVFMYLGIQNIQDDYLEVQYLLFI